MKRVILLLILTFSIILPVISFASASEQQFESKDIPVKLSVQSETLENLKPGYYAGGGHVEQKPISPFWAVPFILILLSIAIFPLTAPNFWHHNYWKISIFVFAIPMFIVNYFFLTEGTKAIMGHEIQSYISFILLIGSLFTISGAILLRGTLIGKPLLNTIILGIGTLLASFMATTGASMLLIRPLIRANAFRTKKVHTIVFFIFTVSNCGGLLTPLGDPPLFLGFLKGVPFEWTLVNLIPEWLVVNIVLLAIYFIWDTKVYQKEVKEGLLKEDPNAIAKEPLKIEGSVQFIFLIGVLLSIVLHGTFSQKFDWWPKFGAMEGGMALMWILSLVVSGTKSKIRIDNEFSWFPIKEVASLFAGIFACMVPALVLLEIHGPSFGIEKAHEYFWITGGLSSFLDNAPTYVVFLGLDMAVRHTTEISAYLSHEHMQLAAISCGAVFMGAMSYIGNAPNFMVKAIAQEQGINMPSFFGYMIYSVLILVPIFIVITFIFF